MEQAQPAEQMSVFNDLLGSALLPTRNRHPVPIWILNCKFLPTRWKILVRFNKHRNIHALYPLIQHIDIGHEHPQQKPTAYCAPQPGG